MKKVIPFYSRLISSSITVIDKDKQTEKLTVRKIKKANNKPMNLNTRRRQLGIKRMICKVYAENREIVYVSYKIFCERLCIVKL